MAVYLKYEMIANSPDAVKYEIHTSADDPEPIQVQFYTVAEAPKPVAKGHKIAANKAIRKIAARSVLEGSWPRAGIIQS